MNEIDLIKEYYIGNRALYFNFLGDIYNQKYMKEYIIDKNNIISAKMSLLSLIMLSIKEEIIENVGNLNFESKIFLNSLEEAVSYITIEKDNYYYLDNYKFTKKEEIVSLIRNKLAHGRFKIDYERNIAIINHEDNELKIDVDKLSYFIVRALQAYLRDIKTNEYTHDFCAYNKVLTDRETPLKTLSEIKNIARNIKYYSFKLSYNEGDIPQICIDLFEDFIKDSKKYLDTKKFYSLYNNFEKFIENYNCKIEMNSKKISNINIEKQIINYANNLMNENNDLNYEEQINIILQETTNYINAKNNKVSQLCSILKILTILEAIKNTNTSDVEKLYNYFKQNEIDNIYINYNEIGIVLISLFNSLFMYGFDEKYKLSGGYKLDRKDNFDFSELNLDNIEPNIDGIDFKPLEDSKNKYNSIKKEYEEVENLINKNKEHLSRIKDDKEAEIKINNKINDLTNELKLLKNNVENSKNIFSDISNDYENNKNYFKNFAIINGIRNSIAHGHYEIKSGESLEDSKIIFDDIFNNQLTFKLEINFHEFSSMLENNFRTLFDFLDKHDKKNTLKLEK